MKEALECTNDGVLNIYEELIKFKLGDGEEDEKMVKISKNLFERREEVGSSVERVQGCLCLELSRNARFKSELGNA